MKQFFAIAMIMILGMILVVITSCKKSDPDPDFPQLIGSWSGNTSQDGAITFYVNNIKGTLYITSYKVKIYTAAGYQYFEASNTDGITSVYNKAFRITLGTGSSGPGFLDGIFNISELSLSGNFAVYASGNNVDIITGTYLGDKK